jgi:hypothetical protein
MDKALQAGAHPTDVPAPGPGLNVEKKKIAGQETEPEAGNVPISRRSPNRNKMIMERRGND